MFLLRAVLNIPSPKGLMCFRCLIFSLSGPCELLFLFYCLLFCVFDSVCELFGETIHKMFGCVFYFVVECYGFVYSWWVCSIG